MKKVIALLFMYVVITHMHIAFAQNSGSDDTGRVMQDYLDSGYHLEIEPDMSEYEHRSSAFEHDHIEIGFETAIFLLLGVGVIWGIRWLILSYFEKRRAEKYKINNSSINIQSTDREMFYEYTKLNFDKGILREVAASQYVAIVNFGDIWYLVCPFVSARRGAPFGFCVDKKYAHYFLDNKDLWKATVQNFREIDYRTGVFELGAEKFSRLKRYIEDSQEIVGKFIDAEFERELKAKYCSK